MMIRWFEFLKEIVSHVRRDSGSFEFSREVRNPKGTSCGTAEAWNRWTYLKSHGGWSESQGPVPSSFCIPFPTFSPSLPPPSSVSCLSSPPLSHRGRPVALIIREYIAVMLSIPPANSNRVHSPTWWYRQEKWPHALQSRSLRLNSFFEWFLSHLELHL